MKKYEEMSREEIDTIIHKGGDKKRHLEKMVADYLDTLSLSDVAESVICQTDNLSEVFGGLFKIEDIEEMAAEIAGDYSYLDLDGKKWGELSKQMQKNLMDASTAIDARTCEKPTEAGECTIDLLFPFSVAGRITELEEIIIDDNAIIYNSTK